MIIRSRAQQPYNPLVPLLVQMELLKFLPIGWIKLRMTTEGGLRRVMKVVRILVVLAVMAASFAPATAQQNTRNNKPILVEQDKPPGDDSNSSFTSIEEEMKAKRAIKFAEKEYQENLDRARDLSTLGAAIVTSFEEKHALDREDIKKLDKAEKLARKIRSAAGGSEDDTKMEKPPTDMASAVAMLGDLSHSLKEKVEKTPKHVISAAVIDEANVLLELIRIVRALPTKV